MTYECSQCRTRGCRLWRTSHSPVLYCRDCGEAVESRKMESDRIGRLVPALPDHLPRYNAKLPEGTGFWGWDVQPGSPASIVAWWKDLPS